MARSLRGVLGAVLGAGLTLPACSLALDFDATSARPSGAADGFCSAHVALPAVFCDDFDQEPLGSRWPTVEQVNGSLGNDSGAARSLPNSLLSIAEPAPVGGGARAVGRVAFPALAAKKVSLRVSFALRIEQIDDTVGAQNVIFAFLYGPAADYNQLALSLVSTAAGVSLQLAEVSQRVGEPSGQYTPHGLLPTQPRLGEWLKVDIDIDINRPVGTDNAVRVALDDQLELDTPLELAFKGETPRMELGVAWADPPMPPQSWAIRYDDFLVEAVMRR